MRRFITFLLIALTLLAAMPAQGQKRNSRTVQKEKREVNRRVQETKSKIKMNAAELRRQVAQYETLSADIADADGKIDVLSKRIDSVTADVRALSDSVKITQGRVNTLKESYADALRSIRRQRQLSSATAFIFSSRNFSEARKRMRYLSELGKWEAEKAGNLKIEAELLEQRKARLDTVRRSLNASLRSLEKEKGRLQSARTESDLLATKLKRQGSQLEKALREQQEKAQKLDRELNRIIEEEARQAAEAERRRKAAAEKAAAEKAAKEKAARERAAAERAARNKKGAKPEKEAAAETSEPSAPAKRTATSTERRETQNITGPAASSFAAAKGQLPMPVTGQAVIVSGFGRHTHKEFSKVEVQNNGIDIETTPGSSARAVYPGTVSMIIAMDGYHNVILVRHGEYITVYAGIATLSVRKGQEVKAGQPLGLLFSDPNDDNRTRLHFEVRHEKEKLNPAQWLK